MYTEAARLDVFVAEQRHWNETVSRYLRDLGLKKEHVRNVMDMRAGYGGYGSFYNRGERERDLVQYMRRFAAFSIFSFPLNRP